VCLGGGEGAPVETFESKEEACREVQSFVRKRGEGEVVDRAEEEP